MSAIINNTFRKFNADNFKARFSVDKIYLMIGKNDAWSGASLGEYTETAPSDSSIPVPIDTTISLYLHHDDMVAAKLISSTSVSHILKRVNWTTGTVYFEYDHLQDDLIDEDFFVFTTAFRVYKCISNYNGAQSTVEPTGTSINIFDTADNYRWKFMFEVQQADVLKFVTTDWIPVNAPATSANAGQVLVEAAAVDGALEHIDVLSTVGSVTITAGGSSYSSVPTVAFSGGGGSGATGTAVVASNAVASVTITAIGSGYTSVPTVAFSGGGGTGAAGTAVLATGGTGYRTNVGTAQAGAATAITLASGASAVDDYYNSMTVYISSGTGNGQFKTITDYVGSTKVATVSTWTTNPDNTSVYEVMPAVTIATSEGSGATARVSSITSGAINKVAMVTVGTLYRSGTATVTSGSGTNAILSARIGPVGGHGKDAVSELGGAFIMVNSRLIGNDGSDFPVGDDFRKVHLLINPTVSNVAATASTYDGTELDADSGKIIYTEFRAPINRASDSTEDIKLVMEF